MSQTSDLNFRTNADRDLSKGDEQDYSSITALRRDSSTQGMQRSENNTDRKLLYESMGGRRRTNEKWEGVNPHDDERV